MLARSFIALAVLALLLVVPPVPADTAGGSAYGAEVAGQSAGLWQRVDADVPGTGFRPVTFRLDWSAFPLAADFDLTVWKPDAFADGRLGNDEVVAAAWSYAYGGPEVVTALLEGGRTYPVTVEPIMSAGNRWTLTADGVDLVPVEQLIPGAKFTR